MEIEYVIKIFELERDFIPFHKLSRKHTFSN